MKSALLVLATACECFSPLAHRAALPALRAPPPSATLLAPVYVSAVATLGATVGDALHNLLPSEAALAKKPHPKYGGDPRMRAAPPLSMRDWPLGGEGAIGDLYGGVEQLQTVLNAAGAADELVVLKFKREGCKACAATAERFAAAAEQHAGRARFFTVDFNMCKDFCFKHCGIRAVPCVHIYHRGELLDALPLGRPSWAAFAERLGALTGVAPRDDAHAAAAEEAEDAAMERRLAEAMLKSRLW